MINYLSYCIYNALKSRMPSGKCANAGANLRVRLSIVAGDFNPGGLLLWRQTVSQPYEDYVQGISIMEDD